MEIKDGRVIPVSQEEAEIFTKLLREQELANMRQPSGATRVQQGQELSGSDSYKLFCAAERRVNKAMAGPAEAEAIGGLILGLAKDSLEWLDLDDISQDFLFSEKAEDSERVSFAVRLASQALINRYEG
jgi:hypothetical protein